MSTQKALEVIVEMAAVYGITLEAPALRAWKRVLAASDPRDVEMAATEWMRSEKWMPKSSEFVARVRDAAIIRKRDEHTRWAQWDELSVRAVTCPPDPSRLRDIADALERQGREAYADALRRRAAAYERWEMMEDPYIAEVDDVVRVA